MDKNKLENLVQGQLKCENCIYDNCCEDLYDRCVANFILDGKVVHLKNLEETIKNWGE